MTIAIDAVRACTERSVKVRVFAEDASVKERLTPCVSVRSKVLSMFCQVRMWSAGHSWSLDGVWMPGSASRSRTLAQSGCASWGTASDPDGIVEVHLPNWRTICTLLASATTAEADADADADVDGRLQSWKTIVAGGWPDHGSPACVTCTSVAWRTLANLATGGSSIRRGGETV